MLDRVDKLFGDLKNNYGISVNDAILLDNGADVMMQFMGNMVVSSFARRNQLIQLSCLCPY